MIEAGQRTWLPGPDLMFRRLITTKPTDLSQPELVEPVGNFANDGGQRYSRISSDLGHVTYRDLGCLVGSRDGGVIGRNLKVSECRMSGRSRTEAELPDVVSTDLGDCRRYRRWFGH